jgi:hypothetical protein
MISKQHIKAFFIAALAFKFPVAWGRRKRCKMLSLNGSKHKWIVKFLDLFFDVRHRQDGGIELWFNEREKVQQKRRLRKLLKRIVRA